MLNKDPMARIEEVMQRLEKRADTFTKPARKRYPLLFAFLFTFSVAAIFQGFEILTNQIAFFQNHPIQLMLGGIIMLALTGGLYKALQKND